MRTLALGKGGLNKLRAHQKELKAQDLEDSIKSIPPGEWCVLKPHGSDEVFMAFINAMIEEKFSNIHVVEKLNSSDVDKFSVEAFIKNQITQAYEKRLRFKGYQNGARIFYGGSDGLPGLIIDHFKNATIIQINTAGVDRYREMIKAHVQEMVRGACYLLDNEKYREKEFLPTYEKASLPNLMVEENGLHYELRSEVIQKVGFYFDHRENRFQLTQLLGRLAKLPERGVDLFSYVGAWGMSALKSGVGHVDFVDQGDFDQEVKRGLELNSVSHRGTFTRSDVFKFLEDRVNKGMKFDLILCDPPAFAKSALQKPQALEGYSKLHRRVLKSAAPGALLAFSSCTQYVSHEEFQKNISDAALKENKKLQLIYSGIQGWDHPVTSQLDRANYIKSYFYILE